MDDEMKKELHTAIEKTVGESLKENVPAVVKEAVDEQVTAALKEAGLDKLEKGAFPGLNTGAQKDAGAKERAAKFFKALYRKDIGTLNELGSKAMTEGTDADGGYLVPEEVMNMVDYAADNVGLIRKVSRRIPMAREIMNMPIVSTKPTVSWPGEATNATESQPVLGNVPLTAKTAVGITPVSNELLADANQSVVDMLVELFAEQLAGAEDEQGLVGTGAPFTGVLNDGGVTTSVATGATLAALTVADLNAIIGNQRTTLLPGSIWVMHPAVWEAIKGIQEGSQSIVSFGTTQSISMKTEGGLLVPNGFLLGYPVHLSEKMPNNPATGEDYAIFGNFSKFYFGDRQQVTVSISTEATIGSLNLFQANSTAVRVTERVALAVGVGEAFVKGQLA